MSAVDVFGMSCLVCHNCALFLNGFGVVFMPSVLLDCLLRSSIASHGGFIVRASCFISCKRVLVDLSWPFHRCPALCIVSEIVFIAGHKLSRFTAC